MSLAARAQNAETSSLYEPISPLHDLHGFVAAAFALSGRYESVLRGGGLDGRSAPICAWVSGDNGEDKGRSYLEAGISAEFQLRKNTRYPVIVAIPTNMAAGDEEYFFGPHFAYLSTGVTVRVPLSFISNRHGKWTAGSSAELYYFGATAAEIVHSVGLQIPKIAATLTVEL